MFSRLKEMVTEFVDAPRGRKSVVGKKEDQDTRRADEDRKKREEDEKRAQEEQNRRERANSSMEITEYDDFQPRRSSLTHRTVVRAGDVDPRSPEPNSKERFVSFERLEKYWGFNPLRVTGDFLNFTDDLLADAFDDVEKLLVKKLPLVDRSEIKKIVDQFYHEAQERNKKNGDLMECYLLRNVFGVPEDRIRVFESGMKDKGDFDAESARLRREIELEMAESRRLDAEIKVEEEKTTIFNTDDALVNIDPDTLYELQPIMEVMQKIETSRVEFENARKYDDMRRAGLSCTIPQPGLNQPAIAAAPYIAQPIAASSSGLTLETRDRDAERSRSRSPRPVHSVPASPYRKDSIIG